MIGSRTRTGLILTQCTAMHSSIYNADKVCVGYLALIDGAIVAHARAGPLQQFTRSSKRRIASCAATSTDGVRRRDDVRDDRLTDEGWHG
jgi:hypothetical protein